MQVKNVQHKQETRFQSSSMEEGAMKYYSASDRRTGEGVQGFGFGNVATGQVVQKKVEFLQRAGSVGRGDSRDGLNPDIRSPTPSQLFGQTGSPRVTLSESRTLAQPWQQQQQPPAMATSSMQQQQTSSTFWSSSFSSSMGATSASMQVGAGPGSMQSTSSFSKKSSFSASSSSQTATMVLQKPPTPTPQPLALSPPQMFSPPPPIHSPPHSDL